MQRFLIRIVLILAVCLLAATVDAMIRGLHWRQMVARNDLEPTPDEQTPAETPPPAEGDTPEPEEDDGLGMTAEQLYEAVVSGRVILLDARSAEEFTQGHAEGAFHLPFDAFERGQQPEVVSLLDPAQTIVVYCEGGDCKSSNLVATVLAEMGFADVRVFTRGYPAWVEAGLPIEEGEPVF